MTPCGCAPVDMNVTCSTLRSHGEEGPKRPGAKEDLGIKTRAKARMVQTTVILLSPVMMHLCPDPKKELLL